MMLNDQLRQHDAAPPQPSIGIVDTVRRINARTRVFLYETDNPTVTLLLTSFESKTGLRREQVSEQPNAREKNKRLISTMKS